jgi:hypothetical protein
MNVSLFVTRLFLPLLAFAAALQGCRRAEPANDSVAGLFWVAPGGDDRNPGTWEHPFATPEKARDAIRNIKQTQSLPPGPVTVCLRGGTYLRRTTFALTSEDSGAAGAPVVYRSAIGERALFSGGVSLPASAFKPVTDPAIISRLPEEAQARVLQADLKPFDITGLGDIKIHADFRIAPLRCPAPELFVHKESMTLARWPNDSYTSSAEVGPDRQPVRRWAAAKDIWLMKQLAYSREDGPITVDKIGQEGVKKAEWIGGCYYYNLMEEIDLPGEYYIDRATATLFFYPPAPLTDGAVELSVLAEPLVLLDKTAHIELRGITFETGRDHGVVISGGTHNRVVDCELRNLGKVGVVVGIEDPYWVLSDMWPPERIWPECAFPKEALPLKSWQSDKGDGGTDNGVIGCNVHGTGAGGLALAAGDRPTLKPGANFAENNHIWNYHRIKGSYGPALNLGGVGNRAAGNLIHGAAHNAIEFNGNDHVMEFNEIFDVLNDTTDAGAVYSGRQLTYRGNVFRHNFVHDIGGRGRYYFAVYLDDRLSSLEIRGNIFADIQDSGISVNGGRDNVIANNIFARVPTAIWMADYRTTPSRLEMGKRFLNDQPYYRNPTWTGRYPELARIIDDDFGAAKGNVVKRNLFCQTDVHVPVAPYIAVKDNLMLCGSEQALSKAKALCEKQGYQAENIRVEKGDPGFVDPAARNFQLRADSPVWAGIPGFERIPVEKIGLTADSNQSRLSLPPFRLLAPVSGTDVESERLVFAWEPSPGATRYRLRVAADAEFTTVVADATVRTPWAVVDALDYGKRYFWKVEAQTLARQFKPLENRGGVEVFSTRPLGVPAAPSGLQAATRFQKVDLRWLAVPGRCMYALYRSSGPEAGFACVAKEIKGSRYTDLAPDGGRTFRYAVKAINAAGESAKSATLDVAVPAAKASLASLALEVDRDVLRPGGKATVKLSGLMNDGDPAPAESLAGVTYDITPANRVSLASDGKLVAAAELPGSASATVQARVGAVASPGLPLKLVAIPAPWDVKAFGSKIADVRVNDNRFTLQSNGKNVWDKEDDCLFFCQWSGPDKKGREVSLQATLASLEAPRSDAAAGVMFREGELHAASRNVFLRVQLDGRLLLTYRLTAGGDSGFKDCGRVTLPVTLRLARKNATFTAAIIKAGQWQTVGEIECDMEPAMNIGLGAYSCADSPMTAMFESPAVKAGNGQN